MLGPIQRRHIKQLWRKDGVRMNDDEIPIAPDEGEISDGLLLCWGLNFAEVVLGFFLINGTNFGITMIAGVGIIQLIYVLPFYILFVKQGKNNSAKGLVIAAAVTALLNATCSGLFKGNI